MKIRTIYKDPEFAYSGWVPEDAEHDKDEIKEKIYEYLGEYITVEIDTETGEITVIKK